MQDRIPRYPGRVKLTPVDGQENVFDMVRADEPEQEGTALSKNTFLTDAVAALLGLGSDDTPNSALYELSKSRLHWWKKRTVEAGYQEFLDPSQTVRINDNTESDAVMTYYYSNSVTIDPSTGEVSLASPSTIEITYQNQNHSKLVGKYFQRKVSYVGSVPIYKSSLTSVATRTYYYDSEYEADYYATDLSDCSQVKSVWVVAGGDWEYVFSDDESAYPTGTVDGVEWIYLGVPFENALDSSKIETGTYIGTGTQTANSGVSLTFGFVPKLVLIIEPQTETNTWTLSYRIAFLYRDGYNTLCYFNGTTSSMYNPSVSEFGSTLIWGGYSSVTAMNQSATTYYYFAFG